MFAHFPTEITQFSYPNTILIEWFFHFLQDHQWALPWHRRVHSTRASSSFHVTWSLRHQRRRSRHHVTASECHEDARTHKEVTHKKVTPKMTKNSSRSRSPNGTLRTHNVSSWRSFPGEFRSRKNRKPAKSQKANQLKTKTKSPTSLSVPCNMSLIP